MVRTHLFFGGFKGVIRIRDGHKKNVLLQYSSMSIYHILGSDSLYSPVLQQIDVCVFYSIIRDIPTSKPRDYMFNGLSFSFSFSL